MILKEEASSFTSKATRLYHRSRRAVAMSSFLSLLKSAMGRRQALFPTGTGVSNQPQSARICSAFFTSSSEPVKLNFNLPALRLTITLMVASPFRFIRK
jgi:hypothetical protein